MTIILGDYGRKAIHHGLALKKGKGELFMRFEDRDEEVYCLIRDNGIGRKAAQDLRDMGDVSHESKGLKLVRSRLDLYALDKRKDSIRITDLYDEKGHPAGTRVDMYIPLKTSTNEYQKNRHSS